MNNNKTARALARLTFHLVTSIQEKQTRLANKLGLTEAELRCLLSLGTDKGLSNTNVGIRMHLSRSRVTRILEGLEAKGYLIRGFNRKDGRFLSLTLSRKGRIFILKLKKQSIVIVSRILNEIKSSQRKLLILTMENLNSTSKSKIRKTKIPTTS